MNEHYDEFIRNASANINLEGKVILDLGCGDGTIVRKIAEQFNPKKIIGIDPGLSSWWNMGSCKGHNWEVIDGDAINLQFEDNYFDVVLSVATFEHIPDLELTMKNIKRVLKPYGKFYTEFAPIWTSVLGHHCRFWEEESIDMLPPWGHLYMNKDEMKNYLINKGKTSNEADEICYEIYDSNIINRHTRKEILNAVVNSGLWIRNIYESIAFGRRCWMGSRTSELTEEIKDKIKSQGKYDVNDIGVIGYTFLLEKYSNLD